jgi:hypothetical protein
MSVTLALGHVKRRLRCCRGAATACSPRPELMEKLVLEERQQALTMESVPSTPEHLRGS